MSLRPYVAILSVTVITPDKKDSSTKSSTHSESMHPTPTTPVENHQLSRKLFLVPRKISNKGTRTLKRPPPKPCKILLPNPVKKRKTTLRDTFKDISKTVTDIRKGKSG